MSAVPVPRRRWLFAALLPLLCGCGLDTMAVGAHPDGGTGFDPDAADGVRLEVGSGGYDFEPLTDGGPVAVIHGPQGGYHIWGSLRAHGLQTIGLQVIYTLELPGDPPVSIYQSPTFLLDLTKGAAGDEFTGLIGYVDDPAKVLGHPLTMRMTATDKLGRTASDEKEVIPYATW